MTYSLRCVKCGASVDDEYSLSCPKCGSFLRTEYPGPFAPTGEPGLTGYRSWLPVPGDFSYPEGPVVFRSKGLAEELGLEKLWIAFNGYWPERGANMRTCTFKELEAPPTLARARACGVNNMVVPSAGNTARAFATVGGRMGFNIIVVIPEICQPFFWLPEPKGKSVKLLTVAGGADYSGAINVAGRLAKVMGYIGEGGARNVARRDGMSVVAMEAFSTMGHVPDHYFQAVGSGTGGIACFEFYKRLGGPVPRFHLVQGKPFIPMVNAFRSGRRELIRKDFPDDCSQPGFLRGIYSKVLTNRKPPYSPTGGVFDILTESSGQMYGIDIPQAKAAGKLFEKSEGVDIVPASGVCIGGLIRALEEGEVDHSDVILLNITGGGEARLGMDQEQYIPEADAVISGEEADEEELRGLFP